MKRQKLPYFLLLLAMWLVQTALAQDTNSAYRENIEWLDLWAPHCNDAKLPRVLLIGNSITRQYYDNVEEQLSNKAYVARLATSKSLGDPALLDEIALALKQNTFDVIHCSNGLHGWDYPEQAYATALPLLYELVKTQAPQAKFIWATSTPLRNRDMQYQLDTRNERVKVRNQIATDFFANKPVVINDLYKALEKNPKYYSGGDGTHLTPLGIRAAANRVSDVISKALDYPTDLVNFPTGYSPLEIGRRLGYHLLSSDHQYLDYYRKHGVHYAEVCTWLGALRFAQAVEDNILINNLQQRFDEFVNTDSLYCPRKDHVDHTMFGCLPLEFFMLTRDKKYHKLGMPYADDQWILPANASDEEKAWAKKGHTWQTRLWIDDMFMITIVQSQAFRASGNAKYVNRAAKEMLLYLKELQLPNGLFYHAPDVPYIWARGDGWMAAGMAELLRALPEKSSERKQILEGYRLMMKTLKDYQYADGMWNELVDEPDFWPETSGTAMYTYAMILGVKHGWLDYDEYAPVARKAWLSLVNYLNADGDLEEVCVGTGKKNSKQYYYDRPRIVGDFHGQAPMLWCAYALLEK